MLNINKALKIGLTKVITLGSRNHPIYIYKNQLKKEVFAKR